MGMSRLIKRMQEYITVNGMSGKADLCKVANRSMRSVEYWLTGEKVPSAQIRYKLARQCGSTHKEALDMAQELPSAKRAG